MSELNTGMVQHIMNGMVEGEVFTSGQSVNELIDRLGELSANLAFVNEQMALSKRALNKRKVEAYNNLVATSVANETYFAPSLAKDYIGARCGEDQFNYELCERCSRTIVHSIDAIRTAISALKQEREYSNYQRA